MKNHRFWSQSGQEFCEVGHTPLPNFSESYPPPPPPQPHSQPLGAFLKENQSRGTVLNKLHAI